MIIFRKGFCAIKVAFSASILTIAAAEEALEKYSSKPQGLSKPYHQRLASNNARKLQSFDEPCTAAVRITNDEEYDDRSEETNDLLECEMANGKLHTVETPGSFVREKMLDGTLVPGKTQIKLSNAYLNENTDELSPQDISLINTNGINVYTSKTGTKTMLMVRVIAKDSTTSGSKAQMSASILANKRQLLGCSHNRFILNPANNDNGLDTNIREGVVEISLPNTSKSVGSAMVNVITSEINRQFGISSPSELSNHVMYCLPRGTIDRSYAYLNHWLSVMNDNSCLHPGTWIHELGHNLYLHHSNEGNQEYMDTTGLMGNYWYGNDELMCFNGPKSWQLGWYTERHLEITSKIPRYEGLLGSVISNPAKNGPPIIIKVGSDNYITFNSATGITAGTAEAKNEVTVTKQSRAGQRSHLIAKLGASRSYTITDMTPNCKVTVSSVQIGDATARVVVELLGVTASPVATPTASPVTAPTKQPTSSNTCDTLTNKECKSSSSCVFNKKKKIFGACQPKAKKDEHDCEQYSDQNACTNGDNGGLCEWENRCVHKCDGLAGKPCKKLKVGKRKICKAPRVGNPCRGCLPMGETMYIKKYTQRWPHCKNIQCIQPKSLEDMKRKCDEFDNCSGFSSHMETFGGCLKKCGEDDSFNGYGTGEYDYWMKVTC